MSSPRPHGFAPAVSLEGVSKGFGTRQGRRDPVLADLSLTVNAGQFVSVLGPSGTGKTTLLRLVDGLVAPDRGRIEVHGRPPRPGPEIGLVFQSFRLIAWETVLGNVMFGLHRSGLDRRARRERALEHLARVGMAAHAMRYPGELSGGMKQRVALARALAPHPRLLLMDEPFASLDAQTRELMQADLVSICATRAATVLFVTHSVDEALLLSDDIVVLGGRPAGIVERVTVPPPRPRRIEDLGGHKDLISMRRHLAHRLRDLVVNDPRSDFFGRAP